MACARFNDKIYSTILAVSVHYDGGVAHLKWLNKAKTLTTNLYVKP